MAEWPDEMPKKPRGRPKKDPTAPKAVYNLSRKERARRALQARVRKAERAKEKLQKKLQEITQHLQMLK